VKEKGKKEKGRKGYELKGKFAASFKTFLVYRYLKKDLFQAYNIFCFYYALLFLI